MKKTVLTLLISTFLVAPSAAQPVTQPFTFNLVEQSLPQLRSGSVAWGDVDGDGDLDAFVSGISNAGILSAVYRNDGPDPGGSGFVFSDMQAGISPVLYSSASWGDFDGDGDLDLALQGSESVGFPYRPVSRLYRNDGGSFSEVTDANLPALHSGSTAWGDYDNDGDQDLLLTGIDADEHRLTRIGKNLGGGVFETMETAIDGIGFGEAKWGDYDADGDLDVLLSGATDAGFATRVFRNDGSSGFVVAADFEPLGFSSVDWGDFDGDGDLDLVISGGQITPFILEGITRLYRNEGGSFQRETADVIGILSGSSRWGDFDNDGDLDLVTMGAESALERRTARIYRNDGSGSFVNTGFLVGAIFSSADWGDFDGDGDLDLLSSGVTSSGISITNLYVNQRQVIPPAPGAPGNLQSRIAENSVTLEWDTPQDPIGPNALVTYNLRVGSGPEMSDVISPLADPESGHRFLARPGNTANLHEWRLTNLDNGTYFWSVQTINSAFSASPFSAEQTFVIENATSVSTESDSDLPTDFELYPNYPNPFSGDTQIRFDLPSAEIVSVRIYDLLGKEVANLMHSVMEAGKHTLRWNGRGLSGQTMSSGVYFLRFQAGNFVRTGRLTRIR
jgi:FlgD Ig-like domain/FG-GAP-like repeat